MEGLTPTSLVAWSLAVLVAVIVLIVIGALIWSIGKSVNDARKYRKSNAHPDERHFS